MSFVNLDNEKPELIKNVGKSAVKPNSSKEISQRKEGVVVESSGLNNRYLLFVLQDVCDFYGIDFEECLVLLYLEELSIFNLHIRLLSRRINLGDYVLKSLIIEDYSHRGKRLYRLSKYGKEIIERIDKGLSDVSKYVGENRSVDSGADINVKSALSSYFK